MNGYQVLASLNRPQVVYETGESVRLALDVRNFYLYDRPDEFYRVEILIIPTTSQDRVSHSS